MIAIFFATFGAVFVAEIVGHASCSNTQPECSCQSLHEAHADHVWHADRVHGEDGGGVVAVGSAISKLPPLLVAALTSRELSSVVAITLWRKPVERTKEEIDRRYARAAMVSFAAIFFSEWGDVGQITAATMAARFGTPVMVWAGAVSAMVNERRAGGVGRGGRP